MSRDLEVDGNDVDAQARLQQQQRDRLAALPDELLRQIFEAVGRTSKRDLCNISRLSKRYHGVADAILYQRVLFDRPELHLIFSESLGRRPRRGSAIQDITLSYASSELSELMMDAPVHGSHYSPQRSEALSRTISAMSNLEVLDISVPDTLLRGIGTLFNGPFDLACLKSCTLFYQCKDDAYWDLRENIHIFAHPTLETLVIRRARLDHRGFDALERPQKTALRKLHLLECDINDDGLADVLEFPEALREFVMTQVAEPVPELEEVSDDIGHYVTALRSQAHSLESFTIDVAAIAGRRALRMRDFEVLRTMRINWDYQLFGRTSRKPRLHSVGLPPELETLEFLNELGTDDEVTDLLVHMIQNRSIVAKSLQTMIVVDGDKGVPKGVEDACKEQNLQLDIIGRLDDDDDDKGEDLDGPLDEKPGIEEVEIQEIEA